MGGFSFTTDYLMEAVIAVVFFLLAAGAILLLTSTSNGITTCEEPPPYWKFWCEKGKLTPINDDIALSSAKALTCAINSAAEGRQDVKTCPDGTKPTADTSTISKGPDPPGKLCFDPGGACVSCTETSTTKEEVFKRRFYTQPDADIACTNECGEGCRAIKLDNTAQDIFAQRPKDTVVSCTCRFFDIQGVSDFQTDVQSAAFSDVVNQCANTAAQIKGKFQLLTCSEKTVTPGTVNLGTPQQSTGQSCVCALDARDREITFPIYGQTENTAGLFCQQEMTRANSIIEQTTPTTFYQSGSYNGYSFLNSRVGGCTSFSQEMITLPNIQPVDFAYRTYEYRCERSVPSLKCTVSNFQLPQDVRNLDWKTEYIPFFGMPQRLLFWEKFPIEEDTWTNNHEFSYYIAWAAVALLPLGKLAFVGRAVEETAPAAKKTAAIFLGAKKIAQAAGATLLFIPKVTWTAVKATVVGTGAATAVVGTKIAELTYEDWQNKRSNLAEEYVKPHPNDVVLIKALDTTTNIPLSVKVKNIPVLLQWVKGYYENQERNLHFVSPCAIDSMSVRSTTATCQDYMSDSVSNIVSCITAEGDATPTEIDSSLPQCGTNDPLAYKPIKDTFTGITQSEADKKSYRFQPILTTVFTSLKDGKLPQYPTSTRTFFDGQFYIFYLGEESCDKGTNCKDEYTLYLDPQPIPSISSIQAIDGVTIPRKDRLHIRTTYQDVDGPKEGNIILYFQQDRFEPLPQFGTATFRYRIGKYYLEVASLGISDEQKKSVISIGGRFFSDDHKGLPLPDGQLRVGREVYFEGRSTTYGTATIHQATTVYEEDGPEILIRETDNGEDIGKMSGISISTGIIGQYRPPRPQDEGGGILPASFSLTFQDINGDDKVDIIGSKGIKPSGDIESLLGVGGPVCYTNAILVSDVIASKTEGSNYCINQLSTLAKVGKTISWGATIGSFFATGPFWIAASTIASASSDAYIAKSEDWPRGGIG